MCATAAVLKMPEREQLGSLWGPMPTRNARENRGLMASTLERKGPQSGGLYGSLSSPYSCGSELRLWVTSSHPHSEVFFLIGLKTSEEQDLLLPWKVSLNSADKLSPGATFIEKFKMLTSHRKHSLQYAVS